MDIGDFYQMGTRTANQRATKISQVRREDDSGSMTSFVERSCPPLSESSFDLDTNVSCSPDGFQTAWQHLSRGISAVYQMGHPVSLFDFHNHFQSKRFFVVASGVVGEQTKLYLVAQRRFRLATLGNQLPRSQILTRCLVEVCSNSTSLKLSVEIRCRHMYQAQIFLKYLKLDDLCVAHSWESESISSAL